jgi:hypothetical protein
VISVAAYAFRTVQTSSSLNPTVPFFAIDWAIVKAVSRAILNVANDRKASV